LAFRRANAARPALCGDAKRRQGPSGKYRTGARRGGLPQIHQLLRSRRREGAAFRCGGVAATSLHAWGMSLLPFSHSTTSSHFGRLGSSNAATGKRGTPRHRQHALTCNLGEVLDLSSTGARIRSRHPVNGRVDVALTDYLRPGELQGEVVWLKPMGNFHYEAGLRFSRLSRDMSGRLNAIALAHRFRRAG
jgi:hypothetical protein